MNIKEQIEEWAALKGHMIPIEQNPINQRNYDQAMQVLEEAAKIIGYYSRVLTYLQDKSPEGIITNEVVSLASHWLKSCGFEE